MKFYTLYNGRKRAVCNCSNPLVEIYREIAPNAVDLESGEILNTNSFPILKLVGYRNIQDEIQSYHDEVDIYSILKKVSLTGDLSHLNMRTGYYGDFSVIPSNMNDIHSYVTSVLNKEVDSDILKMAIDEALTGDLLKSSILDYVKSKISSTNETVDNKEVK